MEGNTQNPYEFAEAELVSPTVAVQKPGGITAVAVIALILAGLGTLTGIGAVAGPLVGKAMQQAIITQAEKSPDDPGLQMQAEIQRKSMAVQEKYGTMAMIVGLVSMVLCIAMIYAAIQTLRGKEGGRKLLVLLCLVMVVVDLGKAILGGMQQRETMAVMGDSMGGIVGSDSNLPDEKAAEVEEFMGTAMKIGSIVGLVMVAGMFLIKAGFYLFTSQYLSREKIKAFFRTAEMA